MNDQTKKRGKFFFFIIFLKFKKWNLFLQVEILRPDHQYEAIFTSNGKPAVNYVGRIEYYERDILAVLQLIDPNGDMVKYHKQHAVEFGLHEDWHSEDWRQFYKDGGTPDTWSLVGRQWEKDITWLKYPSAL